MPKYMPTISLDDDDLPEVSTMKIGEKYQLCIDVELTGIRKGEDFPMETEDDKRGKSKITGNFKIISAELEQGKEKEKGKELSEMDSSEFQKEKARRRSDAAKKKA